MPGSTKCKIAFFAEYQGTGAVEGSTTGFQRRIEELINQAGEDSSLDLVVYCMGAENKVFKDPHRKNVIIKQYSPNLSIRDFAPFVPSHVFPFLVDVIPLHLDMIWDVIRERPDVIHTFQTFGATDLTGLFAARLMRLFSIRVKLVNTITTEIDSYFGCYVSAMSRCLYQQIEAKQKAKRTLTTFIRELPGFISLTNNDPRPIPRKRLACRIMFTLFWYAVARPSHMLRRSDFSTRLFSKAFQSSLKWEIPFYLNRCDLVTASKPEDKSRYRKLKCQVYQFPHACDFARFHLFPPDGRLFIQAIKEESGKGSLSPATAKTLCKLAAGEKNLARRPMVYVGRLSDEKNIRILSEAYHKLLSRGDVRNHVHLIIVGAGEAASEIQNRFGDCVTVTGLIPNGLVPWIYNWVRECSGYFVSASDTEIYGNSHAEALACGLPIVAMHKGSRQHVFLPGDKLGDTQQTEDRTIAEAAARFDPDTGKKFQVGLNGLLVPDYTKDEGLSTSVDGREDAIDSLAEAMYLMRMLPAEILQRMSDHALRFSKLTNFSWSCLWELLRKLYAGDHEAYNRIVAAKAHDWNRNNTFHPARGAAFSEVFQSPL